MLQDYSMESDMTLRHGVEMHRLFEPRYNTELGLRAFENSATRLYNKLPSVVKSANTVESFKKRLKAHLFSECYNMKNMTITEEFEC